MPGPPKTNTLFAPETIERSPSSLDLYGPEDQRSVPLPPPSAKTLRMSEAGEDGLKKAPKEEKDFLLKRQAKAYASGCSIHGLAYIAEDNRPVAES